MHICPLHGAVGNGEHLTSSEVARRFPPMDSKEELTGRLWEGPGLPDATPGV